MTFFSKDEAEFEADDVEEIVEEEGWLFTDRGAYYFAAGVGVPNSIAPDYAVVLWAETQSFDGVWWEENYDPARLSAPRGVIFQSKLESWKVLRGCLSDDDFVDA